MSRIRNVAVVFDNSLRPETTGTYCLKALGELASVKHVLPSTLNDFNWSGYDLVLFIDDGTEYEVRQRGSKSAFWAIDTHLTPERLARQAGACDFVFTAQKDGSRLMAELTGTKSTWLPLACDPDIHRRLPIKKSLDVSFVGNRFAGPRDRLLSWVTDEFADRCFVGNAYFDELAKIYSQSKFVVNQSLNNDINMRVFEALSCGALLLTDEILDNGFDDLFRSGVHLETFQNPEEIESQIRYYLANSGKYHNVALAGHRHVREHHTYRHRMQSIVEMIESGASIHFGVEMPKFRKSPTYYEMPRNDVLQLIPNEAETILEIGSAGGKLASQIKQKQDATVTGIELDSTARALSRSRLDNVLGIKLEGFRPENGRFDCVVCADVLEHMVDPDLALRKIHELLKPNGTIVLSLPNMLHHGTLYSLLEGNFSYEAAGIVDEDHKRFFTKTEIEKLLFRRGFEIDKFAAVSAGKLADGKSELDGVRLHNFEITGLSEDVRSELDHYQYLLAAKKRNIPDYGLTSIVILTHNQLQYTIQCIDSLFLRTDETIEVIVVDNASTDGTVEYLKSLEQRGDIKLILNDENRGFPAGVNQGIEVANGDSIVLLNNDTIVTTGWLSELHQVMRSRNEIGLVGPVSNNVSGEQRIPVSYRDLGSLDGFGWQRRKKSHRQFVKTDRLVGFCLMIDRKVIDAIGLLDEQFGVGCFEDDDLCKRAIDAGFVAAIAEGAFVHHFGSVTFRDSNIDFERLLNDNKELFEKKHADPDKETQSQRNRTGSIDSNTSISLCMIVRDNEETIRPCLESISDWVDDIIVVDTGSTDKTIDICCEFNAQIFDFPWCDDFSAARNESLKHANGDWIFWFDSDDVIPKHCGKQLRQLAEQEDPADAYVVKVHCPRTNEEGSIDTTVVDHIKLFKNHRGFQFEGRIHEQVLQSIRAVNGRVDWSDCYVTHMGSDLDESANKRKIERDLRILDLDLKERPEHPFVLFNLGMTHLDAGNYESAINYLKRCINVSNRNESHCAKAHALLASAHYRNEDIDSAIEVSEAGRSLFPDDIELKFLRALYAQEVNELDTAESIYLSLLHPKPTKKSFSSRVNGLDGIKAHHNLALVYEAKRDLKNAAKHWWHVVEAGDRSRAWQCYISAIFQNASNDELKQAKLRISESEGLPSKDKNIFQSMIDIRHILLTKGEDLAIKMIDHLVQRYPNDEFILNEVSRMVFEQIDVGTSEKYLLPLATLVPSNDAVQRNLAIACKSNGRFEMA